MKLRNFLVIATLVCAVTSTAQNTCRYVTLTAANGISTNSIQIQLGETGELITSIPYGFANGASPTVNVIKDGVNLPAFPASLTGYAVNTSSSVAMTATGVGTTVAGPAQFVFSSAAAGSASMATVKITPTTYDVNKTLILPPGTNQVYVTLQCSSNLVNWVDCTNGVYGSPVMAQFFRIRMGPN